MAAKQTITFFIATIFISTFLSGTTSAQLAPASGPSAAAPAPDCMTNLFNMSDCLSYVQTGSNLTKPDKPCCPELAGLVESSPQCLCYLLDKNRTASYGFNIDMNRALNLPTVCHVSTPPVSLCSVILGSPAGSPTSSEAPAGSPTSNEAPMSQSHTPDQGLAANPSNGNSNEALKIAVSGLVTLIAMAVAFLPTAFGI